MPELQRLRPGHASALLAFERENRAYFAASIPDRGDDYFTHFDARLGELLAGQDAGTDHLHVLVAEDGAIVGRVNLIAVENGGAELGYRIAEKAAGQGLATAAVNEVWELAVGRYGLTELRAVTTEDNLASQAVLERTGFVRVGGLVLDGRPGISYRRGPRSAADLIAMQARRSLKFLPFWGHRPQRDGSAGAGCLSQWWPAPFTVEGHTFATAEHYMMWGKATLFGDAEMAGRILAAATPGEAKALGRRVKDFDSGTWQAHRHGIVVAGSIAKFGGHEELRAFLLGTGDRILVEASPVDRIWGIGLAADDPRVTDPAQWRGLNLLGFALMDARAALRATRAGT